jgi:ribose/xylose/arabinose/galactoside ABC-type transport system permease subunit
MRRSVWGREFELVGASPGAARAAGLPVARYQVASYALAGVCYALAGALLAEAATRTAARLVEINLRGVPDERVARAGRLTAAASAAVRQAGA